MKQEFVTTYDLIESSPLNFYEKEFMHFSPLAYVGQSGCAVEVHTLCTSLSASIVVEEMQG